MPLVSFVIPVYNVEGVLHYCVDSILSQTFKDFEVILVDDGSLDNSGKICDKYNTVDDRVKVIHKKNGGVSSARNTGLKVAMGKYICFVDSDDYIDIDYLECLITAKNSHVMCDNIWSKFQVVDNYNMNKSNKSFQTRGQIYTVKQIMTLHENWLDAGPYCKLYKREIIEKNHLRFDEDISLGEDLIFNFEYLDCTSGKIVVIDSLLYNYMHSNENSLSNKYYANLLGIYGKLNLIMYKYIKKWNCDEEQIRKYYNACFFKYEVILKNTFHKDNKLSRKEKIKYNNKILKSQDFLETLKKMDYKPNLLYRIAYSTKSYRIVLLVEKIFSLKKH